MTERFIGESPQFESLDEFDKVRLILCPITEEAILIQENHPEETEKALELLKILASDSEKKYRALETLNDVVLGSVGIVKEEIRTRTFEILKGFFEKTCENHDEENKNIYLMKILEIAGILKKYTNRSKNLDGVIDSAREILEDSLNDELTFALSFCELSKIFKNAVEFENKKDKDWALATIKGNIDTIKNNWNNNFYAVADLFAALLNYQEFDLEKESVSGIKEFITKFNLDGEKIFQAWIESCSYAWENKINPVSGEKLTREKYFIPIVSRNLETLYKLELERPGASSELFANFGIADFGRYPLKLLISIYDNKDNIDSKYGVAIFPRSDWNGCFYDPSGSWIENRYFSMFDDLLHEFDKKNILLRIVEADNTVRLYNKLWQLHYKYNGDEKNKILFAIIAGHGNKDSITFGEKPPEKAKKIKITDFLDLKGKDDRIKKGLIKAKLFFVDNPSIVLLACSTGMEGGLGEEISKFMKAKLTAPSESATIEKIKVNFDDNNKPYFEVKYSKNAEINYDSGRKDI